MFALCVFTESLSVAFNELQQTSVHAFAASANAVVFKTAAAILVGLITALAGIVVVRCLEAGAIAAHRFNEVSDKADAAVADSIVSFTSVEGKSNGFANSRHPTTAVENHSRQQQQQQCALPFSCDNDDVRVMCSADDIIGSDNRRSPSTDDYNQLTLTRGRFMETHV
jgi:hypothetical protein